MGRSETMAELRETTLPRLMSGMGTHGQGQGHLLVPLAGGLLGGGVQGKTPLTSLVKKEDCFEKSEIHAEVVNHEGFCQGFSQLQHCELHAVQEILCLLCKKTHEIGTVDLPHPSHVTRAQPLKSSENVIGPSERQILGHASSIQALASKTRGWKCQVRGLRWR